MKFRHTSIQFTYNIHRPTNLHTIYIGRPILKEGARQSAGCSQGLLQYLFFLRYYCLKPCKFLLPAILHNVESEGVSKLSTNAVVFSVISQNYSEIDDAWQPPPWSQALHCTGWPWITGWPSEGQPSWSPVQCLHGSPLNHILSTVPVFCVSAMYMCNALKTTEI